MADCEKSKNDEVLFIIGLFASLFKVAYSQSASNPTHKPTKLEIDNASFNLSTSLAIQKRIYFDIGVSWERFGGSGHGYGLLLPYLGYSIYPIFKRKH